MKKCRPYGLYAITAPRYPQDQRLLAECEAALLGGASLLQFRDKSADAGWRLEAGPVILMPTASKNLINMTLTSTAWGRRRTSASDAALADAHVGASVITGVSATTT
jgi:hypothetical protein